ncbi:MAG: hypothetical protein ACUVQY_06080 [Thermoproteota archaeon]
MDYREVVRKGMHLFLSLILLIPFIPSHFKAELNAEIFYSAISILALTLNAIRIKRPLLRSEAKIFMRERREKFLSDIRSFIPLKSEVTSQVLNKIEEKIRGIEDLIDNQLSAVERDYEKIGGYVGLTYGVLGVTISYFLFKDYALYGIISLATMDFIATIIGELTGTHRIPFTDKTVEGSISGFVTFFTVLILMGISPSNSLLLSTVAMVVEAYSIEDNLLLPIFVSFLSSFIV